MLNKSIVRRFSAIISQRGQGVQKDFQWKNNSINYEIINQDSKSLPIVFMPAPFMTTSRQWFTPVIEKMEGQNPIVLLEPPGFGENSDAKLDKSHMNPETYIDFIHAFLKHTHQQDFGGRKLGLISSGVSGCYSLEVAKDHGEMFEKILLANATYQGALPSVKQKLAKKGKHNMVHVATTFFKMFEFFYCTPVIGKFIQNMMFSPKAIEGNLKSHVFSDEQNITPEIVEKMTYLSAMNRSKVLVPAFLGGYLDPYEKREEMIAALAKIDAQNIPVNNVMGKKIFAPKPTSLTEFDEYEARSKHYKTTLMTGSLWSYVEYPEEFTQILNDFFKE